jgi:hypothetical protein
MKTDELKAKRIPLGWHKKEKDENTAVKIKA